MINQTFREQIIEALDEALIMECARDTFSVDNMLFVAQKLSGAPYSVIEEIYYERKLVPA